MEKPVAGAAVGARPGMPGFPNMPVQQAFPEPFAFVGGLLNNPFVNQVMGGFGGGFGFGFGGGQLPAPPVFRPPIPQAYPQPGVYRRPAPKRRRR